MAFNPLYSIQGDATDVATPGRPVNLRRDIGTALGQMPSLTPDVPPAAVTTPHDWRSRATAAAASIAGAIDPNTPSGFGQFAGGFARGFAGVQAYLQGVTSRAAQDQADLNVKNAQADYYRAGADQRAQPKAAPTQAADNWVDERGNPGSPKIQRNTRTGETRPVLDPQGRPVLNAANAPAGGGRPLQPDFKVGTDGVLRRWDAAKHRMVVVTDENGQPFKPQRGGAGAPPVNVPPGVTGGSSDENPY